MECAVAQAKHALTDEPGHCDEGQVPARCFADGDTTPRYTCAATADDQYVPSQLRTARASIVRPN